MKTLRTFLIAAALLLGALACQPVKYADRFGFLPENDALANSEALQRCGEAFSAVIGLGGEYLADSLVIAVLLKSSGNCVAQDTFLQHESKGGAPGYPLGGIKCCWDELVMRYYHIHKTKREHLLCTERFS